MCPYMVAVVVAEFVLLGHWRETYWKSSLPVYYLCSRLGTAGLFGGAAGVTLLWVTDWKAILKYVPLYGSKYESEPAK